MCVIALGLMAMYYHLKGQRSSLLNHKLGQRTINLISTVYMCIIHDDSDLYTNTINTMRVHRDHEAIQTRERKLQILCQSILASTIHD